MGFFFTLGKLLFIGAILSHGIYFYNNTILNKY